MRGAVRIAKDSGFSLVELSIVLVILGLLTGGVLGGRSLIKAAELRSVSSEFQQWQTAVYAFESKYFSLPGDFEIAQDFWGAGVTDNGNGNGILSPDGVSAEDPELFLFWQHLALAGLIPGEYTGVTGDGGTSFHIVPGENAPKPRYGGGWTIATRYGGSTARYAYDYINTFIIGAPTATSFPHDPLFPPEDAWNIDSKFDDGKPGKGSVVAIYWSTCADATSNTDYDSEYDLEDTSARCALYFMNTM